MADRLLYYDHRKKEETNGITMSCFFVWQFMVHSMICMSGQTGSASLKLLCGKLAGPVSLISCQVESHTSSYNST